MDAATDFHERLEQHLGAVTARRRALGPPQVAVRAPRLGIDHQYGGAKPFHAASVGKLFTATLVMQEVARGAFGLDTPVSQLLPRDEIQGLFRSDDAKDVAGGATVRHLLQHTAGVADYFGGRVLHGRPFLALVIGDRDRFWTPRDLLDFSREHQRPVGVPGQRFHYSDTGYVLLGRALEESAGSAFHELLHRRIFDEVGMPDSFLMYRSRSARDRGPTGATARPGAAAAPTREIAPIRIGEHDLTTARSVSCDWAGGGVVGTTEDLLRFSAALHDGRLVSAEHLSFLGAPRSRFRPGIRYGSGMMQIRFEGFSPFLRGYPRPTGHIGVLATHVFHDATHDAHIVMNFGSTREMVRSFRTLIDIERLLLRSSRLSRTGPRT
ncbi:serine hydrolase domain-containing protein [Microbacterium sp. ABRD28]|uniref:serine hydrolase domain-containing protein n=1 Tax=Microbacterium sp. ABRD28 TaxID=2268461 RepID=UPI000F5519FE|nr:serine hydrolase domain-containing protein [Microbacterium sp. ABRD28]AZC13207.1 class A beta-lactamase-related serine hydrolase [Microbacterium sp. ABRD28]